MARGVRSKAIGLMVSLPWILVFVGEPAWGQTGACCTCPAMCQEVADEAACAATDGVFSAGGTCDPNTCPGVPANDDQSSPIVISGVPLANDELLVEGDNICATDDGPPLDTSFSAGCWASVGSDGEMHDDVWFSYTTEQCGTLRIRSCDDADFDQMIAVYDARTGLPLTTDDEVECADDGCEINTGPSTLHVDTDSPVELLIRVGGWNDEVPGGFHGDPRGRFTLHLAYTAIARDGRGAPCPVFLEPPAPPHDILKNRYVSLRTDPFVEDYEIHVQLTDTEVNGVTAIGSVWWANEPDENCISIVGPTQPANEIDFRDCPTLHLTGCPINPTSTYRITPINSGEFGPFVELNLQTQAKPGGGKWWGDCVGSFDPVAQEWTPPQGIVGIDDAVALIKTFQDPNAFNAVHVSVGDLHPYRPSLPPPANQINKHVNIDDVFATLLGFQGDEYAGPEIHLCTDP